MILARYTPSVAEGLGTSLLGWFRRRRRKLPWRGAFPRDPYPTLVSEVMLQQTQVDRVVPVFTRFLERFPTLEALAEAEEQEVLLAFSGLGYYRRARALHAAARAVAAAGAWPETAAGLRRLPGIGTYTAAAVAAFAFAGDEPFADGNIARVAARVKAIEARVGERRLKDAAGDLAASFFADTGTPEVWEALMELGATVCTPAAPRCSECPLGHACDARAQGRAAALPLPRPQRARERHRWVAVWLSRPDGRVLLRQVPAGELLAGLWLVPHRSLHDGEEPGVAATELARTTGHRGALSPRTAVRHGITFRTIEVLPFVGRVSSSRVAEPAPATIWADPSVPEVPVPSLFAKLRGTSTGGDAVPKVRRRPPRPR